MSVLLSAWSAVVLAQTGPIEVPFRMGENAMIVDATLNGRKLSFMFDTGFGGAFVVDNSINLGASTGSIVLRDFVGEFEAQTTRLKTVQLGSKTLPGDFEAVRQPADYSFSYRTHVDGIMGFEPVKNQVFEINFQRQRMIFHPRSLDISQRKPDNRRTFLARLLPKGMNSMEMQVTTASGKKMTLALDTGNAFYATTHRDVLERVELWPANQKPKFMKSAFVASGAVDSWTLRMPEVNIFGVDVPKSYWSVIDLPSSSAESDGTVGFEFLRNFNLTIDFDRRRVWLENFTGSVGNEPHGETGIVAAYNPRAQRTQVFRVIPESPAEKAGIKVGDSVLSVNGKELVGAIGYSEVAALLDGKVDSTVTLGISSSGQLRRLELTRVALVNQAP